MMNWILVVVGIYVTSFLLQKTTVNAVSEVRRAILQLTNNPADFDEVMFALVSLLADNLNDNNSIEAIVEDLFVQVCISVINC